MEMKVEVTSCEGELFGHLLDKENKMPMYRRMEVECVEVVERLVVISSN
jgi:hypothetical protein